MAGEETKPTDGNQQAGKAPRRPNWPQSSRMVETRMTWLLGYRTREIPDTPELIEFTRMARMLGDPRARDD